MMWAMVIGITKIVVSGNFTCLRCMAVKRTNS